MTKLSDPTGNGIIYITQTLHGEFAKAPDMQCAIDIRMSVNEFFHSPCNGTVKAISSSGNGYIAITPDGFAGYLLFVHTNRYKVTIGQRVTKGQILGQIAPWSGGSHLHFGMKWNDAHLPAPNPMDYFDRKIPFKTSFQNIAKEWFKGNIHGDIDWSLFRNLSLDGNNMATKFKVGDKIIFTKKQNKRGGAGTGFQDMGAYNVGDVAIIKDGPRSSQNAQFFDKGSNNKINDANIWFDTTDKTNGGTYWIADIGHFRLYDPAIDDPKPIPTPEPQPQPPTSAENEELKKVETLLKEIAELKKQNSSLEDLHTEEEKRLREKIEILVKEKEELEERIKNDSSACGGEIQQLREELRELNEKYGSEVIAKKTAINREMEAIRQLNELKNSKFMWVVMFLDRLFSKK